MEKEWKGNRKGMETTVTVWKVDNYISLVISETECLASYSLT